jgi:hypothetical protein
VARAIKAGIEQSAEVLKKQNWRCEKSAQDLRYLPFADPHKFTHAPLNFVLKIKPAVTHFEAGHCL